MADKRTGTKRTGAGRPKLPGVRKRIRLADDTAHVLRAYIREEEESSQEKVEINDMMNIALRWFFRNRKKRKS